MAAPRFVCTSCAIVSTESLCSQCNGELTVPTAFECAKHGLLPQLQDLVEHDSRFDVNARDETAKATLLHYAAISGKMGVLEFLLGHDDLRAQVHVDTLDGQSHTTPLFWAACNNQIYAVELLLRHGADPTFRDPCGLTPFLSAIARCFPITAAYLVAKGSDVNQCTHDARKQTALMLLCHPQQFHLDTFRMVLSLQAFVNAQDAEGNTALHHAARNNVAMAIRMLLDVKADTRIRNQDGRTAWELTRGNLPPTSTTFRLLQDDDQLQQLAHWTCTRVCLCTTNHVVDEPHVRMLCFLEQKAVLEDHLYKLSFFVPWLVLPLACYVLVAMHGWHVILFALSILLMAALVVLKLFQRGSYGDKRKAAAPMFGINVASMTYLVASFPRFSTHCSSSFCLLTALSFAAMGVTLYITCTSDPGELSTLYDEKLHNIRSLVESKLPSATKLCLTCLHKRPLRAKHCAELNACIAKFDHYCPFVLNAIGAQNHAAFLGFLVFSVLSIGLELIACYRFARAQPELVGHFSLEWQFWTWTSSRDRAAGWFDWLWSVAHFQPLLFGVLVLDAVHFVWIGYMLLFHVYLMAAALTTNEVVKQKNLDRVYSRGLVRNVVDFFGLPGHRRLDWRRVYSIENFERQVRGCTASRERRKSV
ncbi:hypothetical protein PsorP6_007278 [Peronosclerospora sorghi]|uniref:Uncharacterized protein n=1 Tax=Peronosclerospora sorghi TaxID=230839 RepID=A0ACC0W9V8_9STRA|nr:hypothetical protein PsorP6_007278 [Peronosclerospora sorghi]